MDANRLEKLENDSDMFSTKDLELLDELPSPPVRSTSERNECHVLELDLKRN